MGAPLAEPDDARPVTRDTGRGVRIYLWAYETRHLLFLQDDDGDENWRLHAVDLRTGGIRALTPEGVRAEPVGVSRRRRGEVLVTLNQRDPSYPDLFRIDIATGATILVAENPGYTGFLADDDFVPRLAFRPTQDGGQDVLRPAADGGWEDWFRIPAEDALVTVPSHLSSDGTMLTMRDSRSRNTGALTRIDLVTGETETLAEHPRTDIGAVLTDQDTHAPLACAVTVERVSYMALDPRLRPDLDFLAAADIGDWHLLSRTEDDKRWIVSSGSDTRPGIAYLHDREPRSLRVLYETRPALTGAKLAPMRPVTIEARDGLPLVSYLTLPAGAASPPATLPLVLLVHGGPWARDTFGYNAYHQWLANRGYAVLSVNFRSSTGFGKRFVNAGDREWGRRMDDDLQDAVAWAVGEGFADPRRVAIMGGSYGGYAVLAGMTRNPTLYACGVDVVGPSNLETLLATVPPYWASFRATLIKALGDPETDEGRAVLRESSPLHRAGCQRPSRQAGRGRPDGGRDGGQRRAGHLPAVPRRGAWLRPAREQPRLHRRRRKLPGALPRRPGRADHHRRGPGHLHAGHQGRVADPEPGALRILVIRNATEADIPRITAIRASVRENKLRDPSRVTSSDLRWFIDNPGMFVWKENGVIAGFSAADPRDGSIFALFVDQAYEGRGIGQALFRRACLVLEGARCERQWLTTWPGTRAVQFYREAGWVEVGTREDHLVFEAPRPKALTPPQRRDRSSPDRSDHPDR